jgi:uncharacterized protein YxeA
MKNKLKTIISITLILLFVTLIVSAKNNKNYDDKNNPLINYIKSKLTLQQEEQVNQAMQQDVFEILAKEKTDNLLKEKLS